MKKDKTYSNRWGFDREPVLGDILWFGENKFILTEKVIAKKLRLVFEEKP